MPPQDLFARMWPVDLAHYPTGVHAPLIETPYIATLGTVLAIAMALPLGVLAAHNVAPYAAVNYVAKHSVHERIGTSFRPRRLVRADADRGWKTMAGLVWLPVAECDDSVLLRAQCR